MSELYQSLSHSKWDCKYHVIFVPKHRRKTMFLELRQYLGPVFHELARQKEWQIIEGHLRSCSRHVDSAILEECVFSQDKSDGSRTRSLPQLWQ